MIRVRQVKVKNDNLKEECAKKLRIAIDQIKNIKIIKKSLDCRHKPDIFYVYELDVEVSNEKGILKRNRNKDIFLAPNDKYSFDDFGSNELNEKIVIVGSGPAGLFSAYMLAKNGYKPLIIERGDNVDERVQKVEKFWDENILDTECNVQFGEGGAGTFSDGKLNTLIKDKDNRMREVFSIFVENGAPEDIMYDSKPHIGTDILREVVKNIRNKIIDFGGEFRFNTKLTGVEIENGKIRSIIVNDNEEIKCEVLLLAIGHSARDTFKMLYDNKLDMISKPFAIGVRIQHNQELINQNQYGENYDKSLPAAAYKLTHNCKNKRGVYSFCMCPGGFVVNSSSENNRLAVNGMSNRDRNSGIANSAIIVTISPNDFGDGPLDGIKFQQQLEELAYKLGYGKIPVQLFKDYLDNKVSTEFGRTQPKLKGNYSFANINDIFPDYINESLKEGILEFDKKIKGFSSDDAVIAAIETRTSSPVRIMRDENFESNIKGIYPCGEGAGYSGGITSSAMDGMKVFEAIAKKYKKVVEKN